MEKDTLTTLHSLAYYYANELTSPKRCIRPSKRCKRKRKTIEQIYSELGDNMFRRTFRMSYETFFVLFVKIETELYQIIKYNPEIKRGPNGRIDPPLRLACALRFFAGGDVLDMITSFGISKTEIHKSITYIIEAIMKCKELQITFPTNHDDQRKIAEGFKKNLKLDLTIV